MKKAVILSNMGGTRTPDELKMFLKNMFSDKKIVSGILRHPIAWLLPSLRYKNVWKNYEKIGGSSIYELTSKLIDQMKIHTGNDVLFSMRYTKPYLQDVIEPFEEVTLIPMYPHYSSTTTGSILDEIKTLNFKGKIKVVPEFYKHKAFNKLIIDAILENVTHPEDVNLIFSAHGLPKYITKKGDPYILQVNEHVAVLKTMLSDFKSVSLGFQSRLGPVKWEKPYLEDVLEYFTNENVVIYPISFLIDNSETDYELKIEYAEKARKLGVKNYQVVNCLNDTPGLAKFLIDLSKETKVSY